MPEKQLSALLAKLKEDAGLREKLRGTADLDAAVALAQEAGFDVSKADWLRYQAKQTLELSDAELEEVGAGVREHIVGLGLRSILPNIPGCSPYPISDAVMDNKCNNAGS